MKIPAPHFLLHSEAREKNRQGQWRFVLQAADGSAKFEAADLEPGVTGERLELLAVVRGLEALDQPSRVTLFTPSRYVRGGIAYGLDDWRANDWTWERFGQTVPVKNRDLWKRFDHATRLHEVELRGWRFDAAHAQLRGSLGRSPAALAANSLSDEKAVDTADESTTVTTRTRRRRGLSWAAARVRRSTSERIEAWRLRCTQFGTCILPRPWIG
jgi:ribonuclease HI